MLLEIAVTLIMAKLLNFLFEKYNQPGVVGEIVAGIILGPCCVGYFSGSSLNLFGSTLFEFNLNLNSPEFKELAFIGIVFLLFIIGLDTNIADLKRTGKSGILTAVFGIIIPFFFGFIIGYLFHLDILMCMGIGAIFFATSVTISMRILSDMDLLSTRVGLTLQTAGIVSDIIGLFIFSLIIGQGHPLVFIIKIFIFVIFIFIVGYLIVRYSIKKGVTKQTTMLVLPVALIICFLFAAFAEDMGLAAIIGAFIAGLIIKKTPQGGMITSYIKTIGYTFFIPLFFVWIGASFNFFNLFSGQSFLPYLVFIIIFIILGLFGNVIGGAIGAKLSGINSRDSWSIGIGMMPIMGMALIIVSTETERGIFGDPLGALSQQIKTATLLLIIISCLITPHLLKKSMSNPFIKKRRKERIKKFRFLILDDFVNKIYSENKIELPWKSRHLLFNILAGSVLIESIFTLRTLRYADISVVMLALVSGITGSYLAYLSLKHIMLQKLRCRHVRL